MQPFIFKTGKVIVVRYVFEIKRGNSCGRHGKQLVQRRNRRRFRFYPWYIVQHEVYRQKRFDVTAEGFDCSAIFGCDIDAFFPQLIDIAVKTNAYVPVNKRVQRISIINRIVFFERAGFFPYAVQRELFGRSGKPVHAPFEKIPFARPARRKAAGNPMLLTDRYIES